MMAPSASRRPAPAGGADRLRLPARVRRDAAADRPDRRPARPGAGAGRRRSWCSRSARWSPRWPTTCRPWWPAGSSRASAVAGWCPATLALVADLYPAERRGVPARRRLRGPGARQRPRAAVRRVVLAVADWRVIFLVNLAVGLVLAAADPAPGGARPRRSERRSERLDDRAFDWHRPRPAARHPRRRGAGLRPAQPLMRDLTWGRLFIPSRRRRPLADPARPRRRSRAACCSWCAAAPRARPLVDLRGWWRPAGGRPGRRRCCWRSRSAGVILAFATADPQVQVFSDQGLWYLLGSRRRRGRCSCCTCRAPSARWSRAARFVVRRPGARCWSASSSARP